MREFFALEQISRPHGYDVCCSDFILSTCLVDCEIRSLSSDTRADRLRFLRLRVGANLGRASYSANRSASLLCSQRARSRAMMLAKRARFHSGSS